MKALTFRPSWAYAILHLGKDVEVRSWQTRYRGPLLIHAGASMRVSDYKRLCAIAQEDGFAVPARNDILCGGIVGRATIVDIVTKHKSAWAGDGFNWVLTDVKPLRFLAMKGQLGLFDPGDVPRSYC